MTATAVMRPQEDVIFDRDAAYKVGHYTYNNKTHQVKLLTHEQRLLTVQLMPAWLLRGVRREMVLKDIRAKNYTLRHVEKTPTFVEKPVLQKPDVFLLCDQIFSRYADFEITSYQADMEELQQNNIDTEIASAKRIEDLKKAIEEEKEAVRWGVAVKAFSWLGSLLSIITGIAMMATGVGAVPGALLVAGGVLHIAVQIMEITGGWAKIVKILPGDDPSQKSAVLSWIQIALTVLCIALAGSGVLFGGLAAVQESMGWAQAMIGGIALAGSGCALLGKGLKDKKWKEKYADVTKDQLALDRLKFRKDDLVDSIERTSILIEKMQELRGSVIGYRQELEKQYGDR